MTPEPFHWSRLRVQRRHSLELSLPSASIDQLKDYLSVPRRPLKALLNRSKITIAEDGLFHYRSRPYGLLTFQLQPEVVFQARWNTDHLAITFDQCTIHGLGNLESMVAFQCEATITPGSARLLAVADLSIALPSRSSVLLPQSLILALGERALDLVTERLEKRCRNGLVRGVNRWLSARNPKDPAESNKAFE